MYRFSAPVPCALEREPKFLSKMAGQILPAQSLLHRCKVDFGLLWGRLVAGEAAGCNNNKGLVSMAMTMSLKFIRT